jgi:hypothetical protein
VQLELSFELTYPEAQLKQVVESFVKVPPKQEEQLLEEVEDIFPEAQAEQDELLELELKYPAEHSLQVSESVEYKPAAQGMQLDLPEAFAI